MQTVYKITNTINQRYYIGSTSDVDFRVFTHNKFSYVNFSNLRKTLYEDIKNLSFEAFSLEILHQCEDLVESSRMESNLIRQHLGDPLMYNVSHGASGRRVLYEEDVVFIRKLYCSKQIYIEEAYNTFYANVITYRAFKKAWHGETFKDICYEVYSKENKSFHFKHGQSRKGEVNGRSKFSEREVIDIRQRKELGETKSSVYKDYEYKNSHGGFEGIWFNQTWKHLL